MIVSVSNVLVSLLLLLLLAAPFAASLAAVNQPEHQQQRPVLSTASFAFESARANGIDILETKDGKGLGAFAATAILSGAWVGEYAGEILTRDQVEARYWEKRKPKSEDRRWKKSRIQRNQGLSGDYLFDMYDDLYIDGEDADVSTWCRFMNHAPEESKECNVETRSTQQIWDGEKIVQPRLWYVALRDIQRGEEICYDYGEEYW